MAALATIAAERLVHPAEVVIEATGVRVRGEIGWSMVRWQEVDGFRHAPKGWVTIDLLPGHGFAWDLIRAYCFPNRTSATTDDLVRALEGARGRTV
jgi:hypothetical protein